jgi:hypothetical protein
MEERAVVELLSLLGYKCPGMTLTIHSLEYKLNSMILNGQL